MAVWTQRANNDMIDLVNQEGAANVNTVRADISRWADTTGGANTIQTHAFQGQLRFPIVASAQDTEILSVEHR